MQNYISSYLVLKINDLVLLYGDSANYFFIFFKQSLF